VPSRGKGLSSARIQTEIRAGTSRASGDDLEKSSKAFSFTSKL
jgi:hypothetical protein